MSISMSSADRREVRRFGWRQATGVALASVLLFNVGCYTYQPLAGTQPQPGQRVSFELTDAGRAALVDQLGQGVVTVDGTLQEITGGQYVLGVSQITTINAGTAHWGGERVRIPIADVAHAGTKALSRSRTAVLIGAVVVGLGAIILTRNLVGGGFAPGTDSSRVMPGGT